MGNSSPAISKISSLILSVNSPSRLNATFSLQWVIIFGKMSKMAGLDINQLDDVVVFRVKVVPGSSKTAILGRLDGAVKIKVTAPPEKGKANQCLIEFLAKTLGVKKKTVSVISGRTSSVKKLQVSGVSVENVMRKLAVISG